jgi:LysM repeat protein
MAKNLIVRTSLCTSIGLFSALVSSAEAQNRYGAERDIGSEVHSMRREMDSTNSRVTKLEGAVKSMRSQRSNSGGHVSYSGGNTPPAPISKRSGEGLYHRVKAGETLSSIARTHQVGVDRLVAENHITNPNALKIGQEIYIPGRKGSTASTPPAPDAGRKAPKQSAGSAGGSSSHTVQAGETLSSIARRFGVTSTSIAAANSLANPNALSIGQSLQIPGASASGYAKNTASGSAKAPPAPAPAPEPKPGRNDEVVAPDGHGFYQVEKGDTLHSIAISFGTNTRELRRLNELPGDALHVGDFLLVPVPDESLYES